MSLAQGTVQQGINAEDGSTTRVNPKVEAKGRLLRTEVRPPIVEEQPCVLEGGDISTLRRKLVWQVHSSKFVDKPIPAVEWSDEHAEKRSKEMDLYERHAGHSLTVETEDGYGLVVFMKRGMYDNVPREMEKELRERSENAFRSLVKDYPPLVPEPKDRRHVLALKDVLASWVNRGLSWGRTHFMYWYEGGHPNGAPEISAASCPKDPKQLEAVKEFVKEVSWENEPIGKLMALSDRESKEKFHQHTQKIRKDGLLRHLDQGPHAVNSSLVAIVNMTVQPHRDPQDAHDGWASTNSWGNYEGAWAVFPDLGIMIEQEPGDIMLCRSQYLEHWITKITSGERYCCTRLTKENVINRLEQWVRCPVPDCAWKAGRVSSLRTHIQAKHFKLTDTEVRSVMDKIRAICPDYSAKDIQSISFAFRARTAAQARKETKKAERKAKLEEKQRAG